MLASLLFLGLLPFAAMPFMQGVEINDEGVDDAGADTSSDAGDMLDSIEGTDVQTAAGGLMSDPGETYTLDAQSGETVFDQFEAGVDFIEIDLTGIDGDVHFDTLSDEEGSTVSFSVSEETVSTLHFPGLAEVPAGDISLTLSDAETGAPIQVFLSDELSEPADTDIDMAAAIDPSDPDLPDEPGPVVDIGSVVGPLDPDTPDNPGPVVDGPVLDPIDPDDDAFGPEGDLALRDLMERDDLPIKGLGDALDAGSESGAEVTSLSDADDSLALPNDGETGTGNGELSISEGTPVLTATDPVQVVDGGDGNDEITAGDSAAYVFGGAGDDVLSAGDGAVALFGEDGADQLSSAGDQASFMDGGAGNDTLTGSAGDDVLEGGEHSGNGATGDDVIDGAAGDDLIRGGAGSDTLSGGDGNDVIDHLGRHEEREIIQHHEFDWHIDGDADSLSGGAGDDTLIMDRADTAEGGEGQDLFWVYHDGADIGGAAEITDFAVGEDFLRVSLNPNIGENGEPEVLVTPSDDGLDGWVMVNGDLVAILKGAPTATASDVYAEVKADVFP